MNSQIQYWCKQTNPRIKLPLVPTHWSVVTDVYVIHLQSEEGSLYDSSVWHRVCFSFSQLWPSNALYRLPCNSESTYLVQRQRMRKIKKWRPFLGCFSQLPLNVLTDSYEVMYFLHWFVEYIGWYETNPIYIDSFSS